MFWLLTTKFHYYLLSKYLFVQFLERKSIVTIEFYFVIILSQNFRRDHACVQSRGNSMETCTLL